MREFNAKQLQDHLKENTPFLLDVRQSWEYDICHLDNSKLIPMAHLPTELDRLDKNEETVVICHHGIRSRMMGRYLESAGFNNVINLSGGIDEWAKTVDTLMATY